MRNLIPVWMVLDGTGVTLESGARSRPIKGMGGSNASIEKPDLSRRAFTH